MLNVIFRSCSRPESQVHGTERIVPKSECTYRCFKSLVNSLRDVRGSYRIIVIDDHSDPETIEKLTKLLSSDDIFIPMIDTGNGKSLEYCYDYADDCDNDLIYFVEDDYLHEPRALPLMTLSYHTFRKNLGKEVCIFPLDCNDRYHPAMMEPCYLVPGYDRYWRTVNHTTGTFMIHKDIFVKFRQLFARFTLYGKDPDVHESTTINRIWTAIQGATCFSPIPTLAYHLQSKEHLPLYTDYKNLWEALC